jgi:hypothetical protein
MICKKILIYLKEIKSDRYQIYLSKFWGNRSDFIRPMYKLPAINENR